MRNFSNRRFAQGQWVLNQALIELLIKFYCITPESRLPYVLMIRDKYISDETAVANQCRTFP